MLTVKFLKYGRDKNSLDKPSYTKSSMIRETKEVHIVLEGFFPCTSLTLINPAGEELAYLVGPGDDTEWSVAYVMNESGKTVETIR
jgi:hypothetical protein